MSATVTSPPLCPPCRQASARWLDYRVPRTLGIAYGSGAPYDGTAAGIRDRQRATFERWRATIRFNRDLIARSCREQRHTDPTQSGPPARDGDVVTEQLALPVVPLADRSEGYEARHQVGRYRTPWTWATGPAPGAPTPQAGDLVPAWRCCHCGAIEMSRYFLESEHDCCREWGMPICYYHPPRPDSPYRMDKHWIPPSSDAAVREPLAQMSDSGA